MTYWRRDELTVWLFNMNWTALSFTSFLTLLYVSKQEVKEKTHRRRKNTHA